MRQLRMRWRQPASAHDAHLVCQCTNGSAARPPEQQTHMRAAPALPLHPLALPPTAPITDICTCAGHHQQQSTCGPPDAPKCLVEGWQSPNGTLSHRLSYKQMSAAPALSLHLRPLSELAPQPTDGTYKTSPPPPTAVHMGPTWCAGALVQGCQSTNSSAARGCRSALGLRGGLSASRGGRSLICLC